MAPPAGGTQVAGQAGERAPAQPQSIGSMLFGVARMGLFWYFAMQLFSPKKPANPGLLTQNLFSKGENLDMWVFMSEKSKFNEFRNEEQLIWHESNIPYAVWTPASQRQHQYVYHPSKAVQNNGSLYVHVFFARMGYSPDPNDPEYDRVAVFSKTYSLISYFPKPKVDKRKSLLGTEANSVQSPSTPKVAQESGTDVEDESPAEIVSFWKPNVTINLVEDFTRYPLGGAPPTISEYLHVDQDTGNYYPIVFFNEFWLLRDKYVALNETVKDLVLELEVGPISMTRWQLYLQIDQSFQIHRSYGSMIDGEADDLKRVFLEGNPILLGVTMLVSLLHTAFDFLAFKNDIQFWNKNKSMEGLSARSVVINFACQLIVFLYLMDNETSWMILLSSGVGCCIEFWKIGKAMHIVVDWSKGFPLLRFKDRDSYSQNKTKEYDDLAMKYLSYALYPLVACFAIYSLAYERHKSWYSWILSSLTSCVYTFGFIMMCPQLFINYKLKSVAHLPWRQMTYKFLNTIIDDLFAFVIKMPLLHRLSVFRDDVIFLIYIYQRWVYPVDKKRVNEFGFGGTETGNGENINPLARITENVLGEPAGDESNVHGRSSVSLSGDGISKTAAGVRASGGESSNVADFEDKKRT